MQPIKTHTFRILHPDGAVVPARYSILPLDYAGCCDPPQGRVHRDLVLDFNVCPRDFLRIAIHEPMHALDWRQSEAKVHNDSRELARWLWRLGYRRTTCTQ